MTEDRKAIQRQPITDEERERIWTQKALCWRLGVKYVKKPRNETVFFECAEYCGFFRVKNNTYGLPYNAYVWKGSFPVMQEEEAARAKASGLLARRRPQRGLLELHVRDWDNFSLTEHPPRELVGHRCRIVADDDFNLLAVEMDAEL